ncbi:MAG TPA: NUDIX domain-containing protein [Microvirga sp.]|jgi:8-oxo-dGTP diphosphatase|nr:NUDIX domain-containing protein [Microvirga sp.]
MSDYARPITTVDTALFTIREGRLHLALVRRPNEPFAGVLALPGGYVRPEEDLGTADTALRVLRTKAGTEVPYLEQLYTFSGPHRDPRGWSISVAYYALVPGEAIEQAREGGPTLVPVDALPRLPFDHGEIVAKALERLRNKASYSSLPAFLMPPVFSLSQLQQVYEAVMGTKLERSLFRRAMETTGFIVPIPNVTVSSRGRPAQAYQLGAPVLHEMVQTLVRRDRP